MLSYCLGYWQWGMENRSRAAPCNSKFVRAETEPTDCAQNIAKAALNRSRILLHIFATASAYFTHSGQIVFFLLRLRALI